jgi:lysophospholipase L1-like esterase
MFIFRWSCWTLSGVLMLAGCSKTPTGPTTVAPSAVVGIVPQTSPPVPPRITIAPPRAIGLTRYVAFGDSITWGATSAFDARFLFAAANGGYVERVQAGLNVFHAPQRFTVFNDGLPGEFATNALPRFRNMLATRRPQAVLLLEGINDLSNDVSIVRTIDGLRQMLDAAALVGVPVLIGTMYQTYAVTDPDGHFRPNGAPFVPAFNAGVRQLASGRLNVHLVDLEPVMGTRSLVGADGVHLEDAGFEVMASTFMAAIEAAFPVRGSFQ